MEKKLKLLLRYLKNHYLNLKTFKLIIIATKVYGDI